MHYEDRVPKELFDEKGHYLGRPADFTDRIIYRRIRLVEAISNFVGKNYSLVEVGCGNGATIIGLSNKMKRCVGIEISDEHLAEFEGYKRENNIENCEFRIRNIEKDPIDEQFDRLLSFEVIEHLEDENNVKNYLHLLKDDGIMAITVPNKWWIFETHGARLPLLPWNRVPFFSWLPKFIHERFAYARIYTKNRIERLLEKNGFEVIDSLYITAPMDVLPKGALKDFIIRIFFNSDTTAIPFKSTSIFVVARKKR